MVLQPLQRVDQVAVFKSITFYRFFMGKLDIKSDRKLNVDDYSEEERRSLALEALGLELNSFSAEELADSASAAEFLTAIQKLIEELELELQKFFDPTDVAEIPDEQSAFDTIDDDTKEQIALLSAKLSGMDILKREVMTRFPPETEASEG